MIQPFKNCPFCGSDIVGSRIVPAEGKPGRDYPLYFVQCGECECRTTVYKNQMDAIIRWNTRLHD